MKLFTIMQQQPYSNQLSTAKAVRRAGRCCVMIAIPWDMISPHDQQAFNNHSQSLTRLDERGGLSAAEALAVLEDRPFRMIPEAIAQDDLHTLYVLWMERQGK